MLAACVALIAATPRPLPGGLPWTKTQLAQLQHTIGTLLKEPALRGAQVGFIAADTTRGTLLYSRNADQEFMPASNFKLLVGSAALHVLGPNFSYVTSVLADRAPADGVIAGNLYLRGGGDALLSAADLNAAAVALRAAGVKHIDGDLIADATHDDAQRYGYGWSWDDLPYYYAPVVSALELEDGVVHITMVPGASVGAPVSLRVDPQTDAFTIENNVQTGPAGSQDTSDVVRAWNAPNQIALTGSYPLGAKPSGDIAATVPDPESYASDVFAHALAAQGITLTGKIHDGKTPPHSTVLWSHDSFPMPVMMQRFWYPSDNLMGELLLKELGVALRGEPGTDDNGRIVEERYLRSIGVDPATVSITDGSGLSSYDRITPRDLFMILQSDWNSSYRNIVIDALPLAGVRGTLRHSFLGTPAQGKIYAKTGSISHVRTISGFIQTKTHGVVTFSFLVNQWMDADHPGGAAALARLRGAVLSAIASQ
ncbi:MAG: D-alanyl-D-alanine carboxypeptidase/D-alanyl-D-alanine-endopeptidase [Candidatus Eremiobacteraeota bacterium]|nr:D-alanyl-D-alanine carboxypeptidase/D-alanyl-D-alanine-endopeptidase [Candidatus Eremiobacteraeota bacterium]